LDIFAISESFLNAKSIEEDLVIHGFYNKPIRVDSPGSNTHPKGGVCVYYRDHIPLKHRVDLQTTPETIVCEINLDRNKKLFFIVAYRSPSQDTDTTKTFFKNLQKMLDKIKRENPSIIVLTGDINARSPLLWSGETDENLAGKELSEILTFENLENIIDEPTHLPTDRTATCIDLIITSNPSAIVDHGVSPSLDPRCKHQIIYSLINFHIPPPPKYKRVLWDYKTCDRNGLKNALQATDWTNLFADLDANQMVEVFNKTLLDLAKIFIPSKLVTICDTNALGSIIKLNMLLRKIVALSKNGSKMEKDLMKHY